LSGALHFPPTWVAATPTGESGRFSWAETPNAMHERARPTIRDFIDFMVVTPSRL
jgi:hypothetical protein